MKKVLCILFGIMTFVSTGHSAVNSSIVSDINELDKTINMMAVIDAFKDTQNQCAKIKTKQKEKISNELANIMIENHGNITVKSILQSCISITDQTSPCFDCLNEIISEHNTKLLAKNVLYTTQEQYERALSLNGTCSRNHIPEIDYNSVALTAEQELPFRIRTCREMAIKYACILNDIYVDDSFLIEVEVECVNDGLLAEEYDPECKRYEQCIYRIKESFTPTWEDYKKLYNIK